MKKFVPAFCIAFLSLCAVACSDDSSSSGGNDNSCKPESYKIVCADNQTRLICQDGVKTKSACAESLVCKDGECVEDESKKCEENAISCSANSDAVMKCVDGKLEQQEACEAGKFCFPGVDHCVECANDYIASCMADDDADHPNSVKSCISGAWSYEGCDTDKWCSTNQPGSTETVPAFCREAECTEGAFRCSADVTSVEKCVRGLWTVDQTCPTHTADNGEVIGCFANVCVTYCTDDTGCASDPNGNSCIANRCVTCKDDNDGEAQPDGEYVVTGTDEDIICTTGNLKMDADTVSMPNLLKVGGTIFNNSASVKMASINVPELREVRDIQIYYKNGMQSLSFPKLRLIGSDTNVSAPVECNLNIVGEDQAVLASFAMPQLAKSNCNIVLDKVFADSYDFSNLSELNGNITVKDAKGTLSFPALAGDFEHTLSVENTTELLEFNMPEVEMITNIKMNNNAKLATISMGKLTAVGGLEITQNPELTTIQLPAFAEFGDIMSTGPVIENNSKLPCMSLCALKDVANEDSTSFNANNSLFKGNLSDDACPDASNPETNYMVWSACPASN